MDEKIAGKNPNHKCVCKDTHPGMGPHRDCKERGFHICGCGNRSSLAKPDRWVSEERAVQSFAEYLQLMTMDAFASKLLAAIFQSPAEEALDAAIKNCHNNRHEPPHYHVYAYGDGGQFHICLKAQAEDEESAANEAARICESVRFQTAELIHVGGGVDAYHSSKVESVGMKFNFGSINGARLN